MFTRSIVCMNDGMESSEAPASTAPAAPAAPSQQSSDSSSPFERPQPAKPRNSFLGRLQQATDKTASVESRTKDQAIVGEKADAQGSAETQGKVTDTAKPVGDVVAEEKSPIQEFDIGGKKVSLDVSKPEVIAKKIVDLENGMRKAFSERDAFKKQVAEFEANKPDAALMDHASKFASLVDAYTVGLKTGNVFTAVDNFIRNTIGENELLTWQKRKLERHSYMLTASQEERERMEREWADRDAVEADKYQVAIERAELDKIKNEASTAKERAEAAEVNAMIMPAYQKVLYKDKPKLNAMIWEDARKAMRDHIEAGNELTKDFAAQAFKAARAQLDAEFGMAAEAKVAEVIAAKKNDAMTSIAAAVQSKEKPRNSAEDPAELMKQGKTTAAFLARLRR